jgi:lysophospholipase L1-like esterase
LYRYNCELFLRSLYYIGKTDQAWINSGEIDPEFASTYSPGARDKAKNIYPVSGNNWEALLRIIEMCEGIGADLKLVASPYLPGLRDNLNSYDMWRDRLISELPNPDMFHDYTQNVRDFSYFADPLHMNQKGSRKFLQIMIEDQLFSRH